MNKLSLRMIEVCFYRDRNEWKQKLFTFELERNYLDKVLDSLRNKNNFDLSKKVLCVFRQICF